MTFVGNNFDFFSERTYKNVVQFKQYCWLDFSFFSGVDLLFYCLKFSVAPLLDPRELWDTGSLNRLNSRFLRHELFQGLLKIVTMSGQCVICQVNVPALGYN